MTVLAWNTEGCSCTYFGEKLDRNIAISVGKDGGTRNAFSGYIFSRLDLVNILKRTW